MSALLLPPTADAAGLAASLALAEQIASKDRSNLYRVSQFFEDQARYDAFIALYGVMRVIDDMVDGVPDKDGLEPAAREALLAELDRWEDRIRAAYDRRPGSWSLEPAFAAAVATFPVPLRFWLDFVGAMRFDVLKPRFDDFGEFLRYGEGATVAPTSIYVYLLTAERRDDGSFGVDGFDFTACGRDLGLFAYVTHVLRDLRADLEVGESGLVYLARADLDAHRLAEADLRSLVRGEGNGDQLARWGSLAHEVCRRARAMRERGVERAEAIWSSLPANRSLMFRLIVSVYGELLDRIDRDPEAVLGGEPILSRADYSGLLRNAAKAAGYPLSRARRRAAMA